MQQRLNLLLSWVALVLFSACEDTRTPGEKFSQDVLGPLIGYGIFGWLIYLFVTRKKRAERRQHRAAQQLIDQQARLDQEAETRRQREAAAAQQAAEEARRHQEKMIVDEQTKLDDEALSNRLRSAVSELIDLANVLSPGGDNADIIRSMHGTISEVAKRQRELKAHHFDDDMLQHDVGLVLRRLELAGLGDDLVVDRLRKVMRQDVPSAHTSGLVPTTTAVEVPNLEIDRLYGRASQARAERERLSATPTTQPLGEEEEIQRGRKPVTNGEADSPP